MTFDPNDPRLTAFALGELAEAERTEFEQLCETDPEVDRQVREIERVGTLLNAALQDERGPGLSIVQKMELEQRLRPRVFRQIRFQRLGILVAAALILVTGAFFFGRATQDPRAALTTASFRQWRAAPAEPKSGMSLELDQGDEAIGNTMLALSKEIDSFSADSEARPQSMEQAKLGVGRGATNSRSRESLDQPTEESLEAESPSGSNMLGGFDDQESDLNLGLQAPPEVTIEGPPAPRIAPGPIPETRLLPRRKSGVDAPQQLTEVQEQERAIGGGASRTPSADDRPALSERVIQESVPLQSERGLSELSSFYVYVPQDSEPLLDRFGVDNIFYSETSLRQQLARQAQQADADVRSEPGMRDRNGVSDRTAINQDDLGYLVATVGDHYHDGLGFGWRRLERDDRSVAVVDSATGAVRYQFQLPDAVSLEPQLLPSGDLLLIDFEQIQQDTGRFVEASKYPLARIPTQLPERSIDLIGEKILQAEIPLANIGPTSIAALTNAAVTAEQSLIPAGEGPIGLYVEEATAPWESSHRLVRIALVGGSEDRDPVEGPIAQDVQAEVEFNPTQVLGYRLLGAQWNQVNPEVQTGEVEELPPVPRTEWEPGKHQVVFFELIPRPAVNEGVTVLGRELKYDQVRRQNRPEVLNEELLTVNLRFTDPQTETIRESRVIVDTTPRPMNEASGRFRLTAAVAWFGLTLLGEFEDRATALQSVLTLLQTVEEPNLADDVDRSRRLVELTQERFASPDSTAVPNQ